MNAKRWLVVLLIIAGIVAFFALDGQRILSREFLLSHKAAIDAYRAANPGLAAAIYFLVYVATTALSVPGAAVLTLAGGAIFGFWTALVLVSFASAIGATLAFLASRFLLRDWVESRFGERLRAVNAGIEREGGFYLFALRLVPLFPFWLINLALGLTSIRTWTFYWVSQLGMLLGTAVYVYAGAQLGELRLSPGLLLAFALLGVFPLIAKRALDAFKARRVYAPWRSKRPRQFDYNLVVIGAGSAGLVSAYIGAVTRAKVALVEKARMGGDCLNTGCVPSKALIRSARLVSQIVRAREYGLAGATAEVDFGAVMERIQRVIRTIEPHDSVERYTALGVECIVGEARITTPWTVDVATPAGPRTLTTRSIVIAAGGRPFVPPIPGIEEVGYVTSDTVWDLRERPRRLVVLGGGPIGCELAQAFSRLGCEVTQIEMADRLLLREDPEVAEFIRRRFETEGIRLLTGHRAKSAGRDADGKFLVVEHAGVDVHIPFDQLLVAVGRTANTDGYGLSELGIGTTQQRTIETDGWLRTIYPNITACGDVAGPYQFTHTAAHQAWYAAVNALFGSFRSFAADYRVIPWATFTDPEVARVGLSEDEARARSTPYHVSTYGIDDLDRAITDEEAQGFVKVLTAPGSDRILGVTIVGAHAADLIAEYVLAMKKRIGLNTILSTIHIYPTLAEANKYAAGAWKRSTVTTGQWRFLDAFQAWRRGAVGLWRVLAALPRLVRDRAPAYPPGSH